MIALALLAAATAAAPAATPAAEVCDNRPVYMVVAGPTHDRARMMAYGKAIQDSGLYARLGGYYVNGARPIAVFEGAPPPNLTTLIVRFPCLANAKAFWNSKLYQETILPLRLNPNAGDYTVTVYPEAPIAPYMAGKVGDGGYTATFDATGIPQVAPKP
jgi:uncharacterized protein (DUF1330 family)